jgi:hypothetical protein
MSFVRFVRGSFCCVFVSQTVSVLLLFTTTVRSTRQTGGAFNPLDPGFLYLAVNGNCSVYKIDVSTGDVSFVLSDDYEHRPHEYEMEDITFWDLRDHTPAFGVMHLYGNFMTVKEKGVRSYTPV